MERDILIKAELADATKSRPSTCKTLENKIQSAFENKAEPLTSFSISVFSISAFTMNSFVQAGILDFTATDKVNYKAA